MANIPGMAYLLEIETAPSTFTPFGGRKSTGFNAAIDKIDGSDADSFPTKIFSPGARDYSFNHEGNQKESNTAIAALRDAILPTGSATGKIRLLRGDGKRFVAPVMFSKFDEKAPYDGIVSYSVDIAVTDLMTSEDDV